MSIKQKLLSAIATHPRLVAAGISLAIVAAISVAISCLHEQMAFAAAPGQTAGGGSG
jgi:hypothetical protein